MNNVRHFTLFFVALFITIYAIGQPLKENEIVAIKGEKFVLHQVRTGETINSICRDFKIDATTLQENNPKIIEEGLDIGEILKIPYQEGVNPQNVIRNSEDPTSFISHTIDSRKETPYFIAKEYGITVEQLYAYNPEVKRFRKGTKIRIPRWEKNNQNSDLGNESQQSVKVENLVEHKVLAGETLYSLAKKYNVSENDILTLNPDARDLKAGSVLKIPAINNEENNDVQPADNMGLTHYFEHVISSGETMWGTTQKYNVSEEELIALNPVLKTGFPAGVVIKIPVNEISTVESVDDNNYYSHKVIPDETLYGLAQRYNVTIDEIKRNNPVLANRGPVIGETLIIPKPIVQPVENNTENVVIESEPSQPEVPVNISLPEVRRTLEVPATCMPEDLQSGGRYYTISLFLPLYLEANDTLNREIVIPEIDSMLLKKVTQGEIAEDDTVIVEGKSIEMFKQFYGNSENFLQFYEGVLIAIDSLQKNGINVILQVFDTQNNRDTTRSFIETPAFRRSDLIIGPVYQELQDEVAAAAVNYRIPMISPVAGSSNVIAENPYFFQVNPSRDYLAERTAEMVVEDYYHCNFIVLRNSNNRSLAEEHIVNLIREKYFNVGVLNSPSGVMFTEYNLKTEGMFGLRSIMSHAKENVVIIPSSSAGEISVAISNINNLADDYSITLIATSNYQQRYPSIEVEQFHNLKMKYVYPYWVDYSDLSTINMIESFKHNFSTEPGMFGMQGFDVTYYFISAMHYYGTDFRDCISYFHLPLVQGNYHFQKVSPQGGYMNQGVSVISYTRDYDVIRQRIKGQPRLVSAQNE